MTETRATLTNVEERDLMDEVNDVLNEWDPIGVVEQQRLDGIPLNEYWGYGHAIIRMLSKGATAEALAEHLSSVAKGFSMSSSTKEQQMPIARKLCDLYQRRTQK
jgi:hypothetical protein